MQNISIINNKITISEEFIGKIITTIFPGSNYLDILILIFIWFLLGIITMTIFFYFSKKRNMWKSMVKIEKGIFSIFFGFISFMVIIFTYLSLVFLGYDPLNFRNGSMLPFMILAGFLLYTCLLIASINIKGRNFLKTTYKLLEAFFILVSVTILAFVLSIKTKNYLCIPLWVIVDFIYYKYRVKFVFNKQ